MKKLVLLLSLLSSTVLADAKIKEAWLTQNLYGSDNPVAALRKVTITQSGDGYQLFIANQFSFLCDLEFGDSGNPAFLKNCKTTSPENTNWYTSTESIPLKCATSKVEHLCKGRYRLHSGDFSFPEELVIARVIR
ncbi:MAG: hypothetical protein ACI4NJ_06000 [Cellvibrio sp.]